MIDLSIEKKDEKVIVEYHLKENDRLDNLTLGMLVNNDIRGVIPVYPVQIENDRFFRYDITGMVTMREYLGEYVKKENILKTFYSVALAVREAAKYMINWTSFFLNLDEIYISKETGEAQLLCLPLLTVVNDGNLCNFFKNVLFSLQFELEESSDYVGRLVNFLNVKTYSLDKFIYELENLLEIEHIVEEDFNECEDENVVTEGIISYENAATEEMVLEETKETKPEKEYDRSAYDEKEEDDGQESIELVEVYDEKSEDFEDDDSDEIEIIYDASDEAEEDILYVIEEGTVSEENVASKESTVAEENTVTEESAVSEENVVTEEGTITDESTETVDVPLSVKEQNPFLINVINKQKIVIDKEVFYVGSNEAEVDYCIENNPTVSDKHAYFIKRDKECFVVDNNTKGRTYLNRVEIQEDEEEVFIPHGAHISFGTEEFEFRMHD